MGIIILGKFLWKMFAPVLSFRRLSAKTLASEDLQINPEIEESAWTEILKQNGACFFPFPDLTCPIWLQPFSSDL